MGFHLAVKLNTKYETLHMYGYFENIFARAFQRDFESLVVVVIINLWLLQMASSRRTYTAAEAARHILEGDGSELDRIDSDIETEGCLQIPGASRVDLPVTGKCVGVETHSVVFGQRIVLFLLHVLYHCIDNVILFNITLTCNVNKSKFRALEREMKQPPHFPESRSNS